MKPRIYRHNSMSTLQVSLHFCFSVPFIKDISFPSRPHHGNQQWTDGRRDLSRRTFININFRLSRELRPSTYWHHGLSRELRPSTYWLHFAIAILLLALRTETDLNINWRGSSSQIVTLIKLSKVRFRLLPAALFYVHCFLGRTNVVWLHFSGSRYTSSWSLNISKFDNIYINIICLRSSLS